MSRVFIGRLSHRASDRDVEDFFRGYGKIRDIVIKNGFGFVEFESARDADDAIYDLNGKELCGERVTLEFSKRKEGASTRRESRYDRRTRAGDRFGPPVQTRYRMLVDNLSTRISWQDLKDIIRKRGCEVTYADAHRNREHEAVVCFASRDDLKKAIEKLQGEEINGRKIHLTDDSYRSRSRSKGRRTRSKSRSSSRSRSASCSRSRSVSRSKSRSVSRSRSRSSSESKKDRKSCSPPSPKKEEIEISSHNSLEQEIDIQ